MKRLCRLMCVVFCLLWASSAFAAMQVVQEGILSPDQAESEYQRAMELYEKGLSMGLSAERKMLYNEAIKAISAAAYTLNTPESYLLGSQIYRTYGVDSYAQKYFAKSCELWQAQVMANPYDAEAHLRYAMACYAGDARHGHAYIRYRSIAEQEAEMVLRLWGRIIYPHNFTPNNKAVKVIPLNNNNLVSQGENNYPINRSAQGISTYFHNGNNISTVNTLPQNTSLVQGQQSNAFNPVLAVKIRPVAESYFPCFMAYLIKQDMDNAQRELSLLRASEPQDAKIAQMLTWYDNLVSQGKWLWNVDSTSEAIAQWVLKYLRM